MLDDIKDLNVSKVIPDSKMIASMWPADRAYHIILIIKFTEFVDPGSALKILEYMNG